MAVQHRLAGAQEDVEVDLPDRDDERRVDRGGEQDERRRRQEAARRRSGDQG